MINFRVPKFFFTSQEGFVEGMISFVTAVPMEKLSSQSHTVIVLGVREVGGDFQFILQNWWESVPFWEVSEVFKVLQS